MTTDPVVLFNLASYSITWLGVFYALTGLVILLLGSVVLGKNNFSTTSIVFFLGCFSVFAWYNAQAAFLTAASRGVALFWARMTVQGFFLGAAAMYHITNIILDTYKESKISVAAFWGLGLILTVLGTTTDFITQGVFDYSWGYFPRYSATGVVAIIYVYCIFSLVQWKLWHKSTEAPDRSRQQYLLRLIMVAFGFAMVATIDWLPAFGYGMPPIGPFFLFAFFGVMAHIIFNYSIDPITPEYAAAEIVSTMRDGLVVTDQDGTVQMVNEAVETILGYSVDDLEGEGIDRIIDPDRVGDSLSNHETTLNGADGEVTVSVSSSRLEDRGENLIGWVLVLRDVRERRRAEEKLRESTERFEQLTENIEDVFWLYDLEAECFLYWSPSYEEVFGEPLEEAPGGAEEWARRVASGTDRYSEARLLKQLEAGEGFSVDYRLDAGTGPGRWISGEGVPVRDEDGNVYRMAGLARDETEVRRKNEVIREKNRELEQFAYAASHDLREPLRQLLTFCEFAEEDLESGDTESLREDLADIQESGSAMEELIQALLQLSRAGRDALEIEEMSLRECVESVLELFAESIREKRAEIHTPTTWPTVKADKSLLQQVLQNLIGNALKYNEGEPTVEVVVEEQSDRTVVGVRDDGIGIDPEQAERIFRPFERLHGEDEYEGTGMGLGICRKIVERHGGEIWLDTDWTEGTFVKFSLPDEPGGSAQLESEDEILSSPV